MKFKKQWRVVLWFLSGRQPKIMTLDQIRLDYNNLVFNLQFAR